MIRIFQTIWGIIGSVIIFTPLLVLNLVQILCLPVTLISPPLFRKISTTFAGMVWGFWAILFEYVYKAKLTYHGDNLPEKENAIVFANHQSMSDIVVLVCIARCKKMVNHLKWLVKDPIKYVPGIGWGMLLLDCIFLKRNWADDKISIDQTFEKIVTNRIPLWLVSFPEGTRRTSSKLEKSQSYEKSKGWIPMKNLLSPRTKGFIASVQGLKSHIQAIYSLTICYHDPEYKLWDLLCGRVRNVSIFIRRFAVDSIPSEEGSKWLVDHFRTMDENFALMANTQLSD